MLPVAPGRDRAAAELAEARLEALDAGLERGEHVGQALPARVVEVRGQLDVGAERARARRRRTRAPGAGWPCRWCRRSRSPARRRRAGARRSRARARAARGPRRGSRSDVEITPSQRSPALARAAEHVLAAPASDSAIERLTFLRLCVSEADRKTLISSNAGAPRWPRSSAVVEPAPLGISTRHADLVGHVDAAEHLAPRRRAAGSRRRARSSSPRAAAGRCARARRSARLALGRDDLGLVLKAVARADLADRIRTDRHGSAAARIAPSHARGHCSPHRQAAADASVWPVT